MSTETDATNLETGVAGQGSDAPSDDIETEAFDRVEATDDVDDPAATASDGDADPDAGADDKAKDGEDDHVEVERNGQKYKVPKVLHGELLMQADYTAKTTDLAQKARTLAEERTTWESQREQSRAALPAEHAQVAILEHQLSQIDAALNPEGKGLGAVDWAAYRTQVQGLAADDPERLRYDQLRGQYMALRDSRIDLHDQAEAAKKTLQTKEAERLETQRTADEAGHAKLVEETGKALVAAIPGWNPAMATDTAKFMVTDLGITVEEVGDMTDPRIWLWAHRLRAAEAENAKLKTTQKQQQTADNHAKAQTTTPAVTTKGSGSTPRDPSTPRGDALSTKEWMERRNRQDAAKRRA